MCAPYAVHLGEFAHFFKFERDRPAPLLHPFLASHDLAVNLLRLFRFAALGGLSACGCRSNEVLDPVQFAPEHGARDRRSIFDGLRMRPDTAAESVY